MYLAFLIIGVAGFIVTLTIANGEYANLSSSFALPIIMGGMFTAFSKNPLLTFNEKHLEVKLAPAASRVFLKKSDFKSVTVSKKKIIIESSVRKPLKIHLSLFEETDQSKITSLFEKFAHVTYEGQ